MRKLEEITRKAKVICRICKEECKNVIKYDRVTKYINKIIDYTKYKAKIIDAGWYIKIYSPKW